MMDGNQYNQYISKGKNHWSRWQGDILSDFSLWWVPCQEVKRPETKSKRRSKNLWCAQSAPDGPDLERADWKASRLKMTIARPPRQPPFRKLRELRSSVAILQLFSISASPFFANSLLTFSVEHIRWMLALTFTMYGGIISTPHSPENLILGIWFQDQ